MRVVWIALRDALGTVRKMTGETLSETEILEYTERIIPNLIDVFSCGECDPLALRISGVHGLLMSQVRAAQEKERRAAAGR